MCLALVILVRLSIGVASFSTFIPIFTLTFSWGYYMRAQLATKLGPIVLACLQPNIPQNFQDFGWPLLFVSLSLGDNMNCATTSLPFSSTMSSTNDLKIQYLCLMWLPSIIHPISNFNVSLKSSFAQYVAYKAWIMPSLKTCQTLYQMHIMLLLLSSRRMKSIDMFTQGIFGIDNNVYSPVFWLTSFAIC